MKNKSLHPLFLDRHFLDSAFRRLSDREFEAFCSLERIFLEKNTEINLSAIRDTKGVWEKHFFDSLLGASSIEEAKPKKILDIGAGGGFPSLPLAILFPHIHFFPLDSIGKKMKAVSKMANALGLKNVSLLCGRAEDLARAEKHRAQYEFVTARAVAPFPVLLEITLPFVQRGGIFLAYRGPDASGEDELFIEKMGGMLRSKKSFSLPSGDTRMLWKIEKIKKTDPRFPRKAGIPQKKPLTIQDF